ncbi:hypothetical protein KC19_1G097700 [Ceratodon purpureus]|uniref:Major facilitator superfamily (MFS) profile domain-containing protein n=1 Tax=Ceratodon purpureus TaxID=3225 RepID=A0A8T0J3A3_CERPU|nr:hypothetical protein KC19_1G097700 [Ceratodon purpureus]
MRGLCLNSTIVRPGCFVRNDALEFLSHNGKSRGQNAMQVSNRRVSHYIVCGKRLFLRSRNFDPLSIKNRFAKCSEKIVYSRVYGSPPDVPVREVHVQDGEDNEEKSEVISDSSETTQDIVQGSIRSWGDLPPRFKLILTTALAFVICNMDKVNMSVAIIPMSHQLGWNSTTAGLVQSSFFWGYCMSQLPGGWLAKAFSGQSMPLSERSRAVATVFSGLNVGSVVGLLLAPFMIEHFGWESVFYAFGLLGIIWCLLFESAVGSSMLGNGPTTTEPASGTLYSSGSENGSSSSQNGSLRQKQLESAVVSNGKPHSLPQASTSTDNKTPWKAFFKSPAVLAMIYAHFCGNWGHYTLLSWLPTYFSQELHLDLTHAALVSILPPLASVAVTSVAAPLADSYISRGYDVTLVRKVCQTIGFLSPAACMAFAALSPKLNPWMDVAILTSGLGLSSFTFSGLYCTHQDISPKYASVLLGITNSIGAIPGVLGVALVGIILDRTQSWTLALFAPSIFFYLTGTIVWNIFASSKPQTFES